MIEIRLSTTDHIFRYQGKIIITFLDNGFTWVDSSFCDPVEYNGLYILRGHTIDAFRSEEIISIIGL